MKTVNLRDIALTIPTTPTTPEHVAAVLREAITCGVLKPGQTLPADLIAGELEVSRSPVREALRQLESEGLIRYFPHRGAVVASLSEQEILNLFEVRQILEIGALELAFERLTPEVLEHLKQLERAYEESADLQEMRQLDVEFHETLYQLQHNPQLRDLITSLRLRADASWNSYRRLSHHKGRFSMDHRDLLRACEAQDLREARAVLKCHLEQTALMLVQQIQAEQVPAVRKRRIRPEPG